MLICLSGSPTPRRAITEILQSIYLSDPSPLMCVCDYGDFVAETDAEFAFTALSEVFLLPSVRSLKKNLSPGQPGYS